MSFSVIAFASVAMESLLSSLLLRLAQTGFTKLKDSQDFKALKRIAHERIARELFWNFECMSARKPEERVVYLSLMRTEAFDDLVKISAPLDDIFSAPVISLKGPPVSGLPKQLRLRLQDVSRLSMLLDRTYNRIWMLHHRIKNNISLGDLSYLRQLIRLSMIEVARGRPGFTSDLSIITGNDGLPVTTLHTDELNAW